MIAQKSTGKVGIGVTDPSHKLTVQGNIKIMEGSLVFSDGTTLNSTTYNSKGGPVSTTGSVVLKADTDLDTIGDFAVKVSGKNRFIIKVKNEMGYAGINEEEPRQTLEISGGLLVGDSDKNETGSIRFRNGQFEGFNGKSWNQIDTLNLIGGGWNFDPSSNISYSQPTTRFGVGTVKPRESLDVIGNIKADKVIGQAFSGNGTKITDIEAKNITGTVSVAQGGIGQVITVNNRRERSTENWSDHHEEKKPALFHCPDSRLMKEV